jgi:hypothetical protein
MTIAYVHVSTDLSFYGVRVRIIRSGRYRVIVGPDAGHAAVSAGPCASACAEWQRHRVSGCDAGRSRFP